MTNLNAFRPGKKEGTIVTAKCRLIYGSLFSPTDMRGSTSGPEDKLKYRLGILVPASADTTYLRQRVDEVIKQQSAKDQQQARKPFIKVADQNSLARYADEFPLLLRCNSKYKPDVVGPKRNPLEEDEAYSGRWGVASLNPYWYPSIDGGKPGVALGLQAVQFLDHADPIGGSRVSAEDEFEVVEVDGDDSPASSAADSSAASLFD